MCQQMASAGKEPRRELCVLFYWRVRDVLMEIEQNTLAGMAEVSVAFHVPASLVQLKLKRSHKHRGKLAPADLYEMIEPLSPC